MREFEDDAFETWTIYENPDDFPNKFVLRKYILDKPTDELITGDSLEEVRQHLPANLVMMPRSDFDPPSVVETWF